ncbi:putative manganese-dependent inorganic diphosphatase [Thermosediminibacter oceani]|uniref:inorganic diphosphatase n=1 Tax=Thermosediminibacter oceani (strain ATCC BAA-1034 / DSM 16646 / JW/IW-1228P) TaxID=555079 RepID=D9RY46_THEOJ|nr:putative manganese-dependent inorganic diphosphatase [Thermosediminibacter oceani]ADL08270.1 Inorganic diphosphatase [Thermosediminibacter oceani DSM 16646]
MGDVYIFGHKNPDTDSICSAIAYSDFKNLTEKGHNYIPARLGAVSRETQYVLDYFGVTVPRLIENVYTQVSDIQFDEPVNVNKDASIFQAREMMIKHNAGTINIVDDDGKFLGLATLGDISKTYLESSLDFSQYKVPVKNIAETLKGEVLVLKEEVFSGNIFVADMQIDDIQSRIKECDILIAGNRKDVQLMAVKGGIKILVVTGSHEVTDDVLRAAKANGVTVIKAPCDTFDAMKLINQSIPVQYSMKTQDLVTFSLEDTINDVKETMQKYAYRSFPVLDGRKRPVGMLARHHIKDYPRKNVILVDHNEKSQSAEGIEQANILEIIDHHRLGGLETEQPIVFTNRPVGCTATIILRCYEEKNLVPSKEIAGLMCAAILSDTLIFKSPTCTDEDVRAAKKLAGIAGIEIEKFGRAMFEAGTSLEGKTEEEIFFTDFKEFKVGDFKFGVSQVNTFSNASEPLKNRLIQFMEKLRADREYDFLLLMLTDIINESSECLFEGNHDELIKKAFGVDFAGYSFLLPGVVSRKKQVIPRIISAINSLS